MLHLASWIRESDDALFARFFALRPDLRVSNARLGAVDLASIHGLLVTGGPDIAAEFHREPPADPALIMDPEPVRDAWEFAAVRAACERGLPILAICIVMTTALLKDLRADHPPLAPPVV